MAIDAVGSDVQLATDKPFCVRRLTLEYLVPRLDPIELFRLLRPELLRVAGCFLVDARVWNVRLTAEFSGGLEGSVLFEQYVDVLSHWL